MIKINQLLIAVFASLLLVSCGEAEQLGTKSLSVQTTAVGPLFEGVNTSTIEFDVKTILPKNVNKEDVSEVKIKKISLTLDTARFPVPKSFTVLLASPNNSMKECGFGKESEIKNGKFIVSLAKNQEFVTDLFKDQSQTLVIDFNLSEDWDDDYIIGAEVEWDIQINK